MCGFVILLDDEELLSFSEWMRLLIATWYPGLLFTLLSDGGHVMLLLMV